MSHPLDLATPVLKRWALPVSRTTLELCVHFKSRLSGEFRKDAGSIATRLHLINEGLSSFPADQIDPEVEKSCSKVLEILAGIYCSSQDTHAAHRPSDCDALFLANSISGTSLLRTDPLEAFFGQPGKTGLKRALENNCNQLHKHLFVDESSLPLNIQNCVSTEKLDSLSNEAFAALEQHIRCDPTLHVDRIDGRSGVSEWHPTRICLGREASSLPNFNFLVSTMDMTYWQDFLLEMCKFLDLRRHSCLEFAPRPGCGETLSSVLESYELQIRDKLVLAYNIARAYMTFYDSKLMRLKWTSGNIHFMPLDNDGCSPPASMPLRAYLSFPFGENDSDEMQDFIQNERMTHCYPRIFDLGILLLEIGLGETFPTLPCISYLSQVNRDHRIALALVRKLKGNVWKGFEHKSAFDEVVGFCMNMKPQTLYEKNDRHAGVEALSSTTHKVKQDGILGRKHLLFNKVVRPLAWLVNQGFGNPDRTTLYIRRLTSNEHHQDQPTQPLTEFHSSRSTQSMQWLDNLCNIGKTVAIKSSRRPVIAILDTGLSPVLLNSEFGEDAVSRIKYMNFVDDSGMVDDCGHGTFMTGLAMKCAPFATFLVARIAANSKELIMRQDTIAKV
ncbi:hypothetical protein PG985_002383 [Apiospora marii]|uniref:uncharacterized protein n=1 Tax=Apiospora marii TaxID=335849 RepID=UPI00312FF614